MKKHAFPLMNIKKQLNSELNFGFQGHYEMVSVLGRAAHLSSSGGDQVCCCCFYSEQMAEKRSVSKFEQNPLLFFANKPISNSAPSNINREKF